MDDRAWDERYAGSELLWSAEPNRFVAAEVADLPPGRALDVACGEGRNAVWLAERGWDVVGIDFSEVGLDKARRLAAARGVEVRWVRDDVTAAHLGDEDFDLVLVAYLHLLPEQLRTVHAKAAAAVAPGGTLLIVGHARDNLENGYGGPQEAARLLVPSVVAGQLADLDVEVAEEVLRPVETEEGERTAIDALVRATRPE